MGQSPWTGGLVSVGPFSESKDMMPPQDDTLHLGFEDFDLSLLATDAASWTDAFGAEDHVPFRKIRGLWRLGADRVDARVIRVSWRSDPIALSRFR